MRIRWAPFESTKASGSVEGPRTTAPSLVPWMSAPMARRNATVVSIRSLSLRRRCSPFTNRVTPPACDRARPRGDGRPEVPEEVEDPPVPLGHPGVEALEGHVPVREGGGDEGERGGAEVPGHGEVPRAVRLAPRDVVPLARGLDPDAEGAHHVEGPLHVGLGADGREDMEGREGRGERTREEETRDELGADRPGGGDLPALHGPADLHGRAAVLLEGARGRPEADEGVEEGSHGPLPQAGVPREDGPPVAEGGDAGQEAQGRARVPGVDGRVGRPEALAGDPEAVLRAVDGGAEGLRPREGRLRVLREKRAGGGAGA